MKKLINLTAVFTILLFSKMNAQQKIDAKPRSDLFYKTNKRIINTSLIFMKDLNSYF